MSGGGVCQGGEGGGECVKVGRGAGSVEVEVCQVGECVKVGRGRGVWRWRHVRWGSVEVEVCQVGECGGGGVSSRGGRRGRWMDN